MVCFQIAFERVLETTDGKRKRKKCIVCEICLNKTSSEESVVDTLSEAVTTGMEDKKFEGKK
jgi:hypothetical protein